MKVDCILTAVNENRLYLDFIPIFIKTWNKLYPGIDVKIILVSKNIPVEYLEYKDNIILFEPIENILTSFTAQFIRLLYPCLLNYENGVMITDMDMLPMNRTYYTKPISPYDNSKFIYLRENVCFKKNEIAMCYNVAAPNIWKDIFEIQSLEDIRNEIKNTWQNNIIKEGHGNKGWNTDQIILYKKIMAWNERANNLVCLKEKDTEFKRLDRHTFVLNDEIKTKISNGVYSDYHCFRPMSKYSKINYDIYDLL
jgi:hypothetical protein